jgi:hypothetical protein
MKPSLFRQVFNHTLFSSSIMKWIVFLSCCTCSAISQDIVALYHDFLPTPVLNNSTIRKMVLARLEAKAKLHPDLIYFQIEQIVNQYKDTNDVKFREITNFIHQKEIFYSSKRRDWANEQLIRLNELPLSSRIRSLSKSYYKVLIKDTSQYRYSALDPIVLDRNLMDFCSLLYSAQDTSIHYDSTKDYRNLLIEQYKSVLKLNEELYHSIDQMESTLSDNKIESILQPWYMYGDAGIEFANHQDYHDAYQMIVKILEHNYSTRRHPRFSITAGYCFNNSTFTYANTLPVQYTTYFSYSKQPETYYNPEIDINYHTRQYMISLGYKFFTMDYINMLSYVNFQLMFSWIANPIEMNELKKINSNNKESNIDISTNETLKHKSTLHSMNTYTAKISVPVILIGKSLFLEVSANVGYLHLSSSTSYAYNMTKSEGYIAGSLFSPYYYSHLIATGFGKREIDTVDNFFIIYPTIDIACETNWGVRLSTGFNNRYFALFCEYCF